MSTLKEIRDTAVERMAARNGLFRMERELALFRRVGRSQRAPAPAGAWYLPL
jgi:hypothetical protein